MSATATRPRPAALNITAAAAERIRDLMARAPEDAVGVRLSKPKRGYSGLAYSVDYVADAKPMDERIDTAGGALCVDGGSLLYLIGSTIDWRRDHFPPGIVLQKTTTKDSVGCCESLLVV